MTRNSAKNPKMLFSRLCLQKKFSGFFPRPWNPEIFTGWFWNTFVGHVCHFYKEKKLENFKPEAHNNKEPKEPIVNGKSRQKIVNFLGKTNSGDQIFLNPFIYHWDTLHYMVLKKIGVTPSAPFAPNLTNTPVKLSNIFLYNRVLNNFFFSKFKTSLVNSIWLEMSINWQI